MTIAEVAKQYSLSADTLRYYERVGLLPNVHRTAGGIRDYSEEDCRWVGYIKWYARRRSFRRDADRICQAISSGGRDDSGAKKTPA